MYPYSPIKILIRGETPSEDALLVYCFDSTIFLVISLEFVIQSYMGIWTRSWKIDIDFPSTSRIGSLIGRSLPMYRCSSHPLVQYWLQVEAAR